MTMRLVLSFAILHIIVVVVVVVRISAVVLRILIIIVPKRRDESPHDLSHSTSTSLSSLSKTSRTRAKKKKKKSTNFVRMIFEEKTRDERDVLVTLEDEKSAHITKILPNSHSSERKEEEEKRELARGKTL